MIKRTKIVLKNLRKIKGELKEKILEFVKKNKSNNKVIVGLGAATKGNTLLNFCGLNYKDILCILEKSPHKIGKYMPGSGIKILDEKKITKYDAAIILPWNITKHLHKKFLQKIKLRGRAARTRDLSRAQRFRYDL